MAEYINNDLQTILTNQNVLYDAEVVRGTNCIIHREGSGIVTLKGITSNCKARYKVSFGGNLAIPAGGTVGAISVALAISGEPLTSSTMIVTPTAVADFYNVFGACFIEVPKGCCMTISVINTSTQAISVSNANLIVERVA